MCERNNFIGYDIKSHTIIVGWEQHSALAGVACWRALHASQRHLIELCTTIDLIIKLFITYSVDITIPRSMFSNYLICMLA